MLVTPRQVRRKEFTTFGGWIRRETYLADEVDEFLDDVAMTIQALYRDRGRLLDRIRVLQDRITVLEAEKGVRDAGVDDE